MRVPTQQSQTATICREMGMAVGPWLKPLTVRRASESTINPTTRARGTATFIFPAGGTPTRTYWSYEYEPGYLYKEGFGFIYFATL